MDSLSQLFTQAATLMLTGMVFVFVFLGVLVIFINVVLKKLANKYPDAITPKRTLAPISKNTQSTNAVSPSIVAAISSAVSTYRQQHNNNH
jgi:oxaloacetate decarboxylase gamma subunit